MPAFLYVITVITLAWPYRYAFQAFDVTRKVTYQNMNAWYKELRQYRPKIPVIVVANKIDCRTMSTGRMDSRL